MLLYSLLWLTGYPEITIDDLKHFRKVGSPTAGHPEYGHLPGIETTTGPLGQGISNAVGMALAERILNARFGDDLVSHKTYVIASDGDLMEGISHEAIGLAGNLKLSNLIVLWDDNNITIDGALSLSSHTDQLERFEAEGWTVDSCDGHDAADIFRALQKAQDADRPVLIACRTIIGFGMPGREGTQKAHSDAPGADVVAGARKELDWPYDAFRRAGRPFSTSGARSASTAPRTMTPGPSASPPANGPGIRRHRSMTCIPASLSPALVSAQGTAVRAKSPRPAPARCRKRHWM